MPAVENYLTVIEAAQELGLSPGAVRAAIGRGLITPLPLDGRTNLVPREQVERYKAQHRGRRGRPAKTEKRPPARPAD